MISEQQQGSFIILVLLSRVLVIHEKLLSLRIQVALNAKQRDLIYLSHGMTKAADWKGVQAYQRV